MESVVIVLMILVCFIYLLKQTYRKFYNVLFSAVVAALFVGFAWVWAIEQNKAQITGWLNDVDLMKDIAVILSIEILFQLSFCILAAQMMTTGVVSKKKLYLYKALRWFPGIMFYPVLFSFLVALIFALPGVSFKVVSWSLAAAVLVVIPGFSWLLKKALPEKELRLEMLFVCNVLVALLAIVATVNGQTAVKGISEVNFSALLGILGLIVAGGVCGVFVRRLKLRRLK